MKKILIVMFCFIMQLTSSASTTYFLADEKLEKEKIYITGVKGDDTLVDKFEIEDSIIYDYEIEENGEKEKIKMKLFKISVLDSGIGAKLVIGYKDPRIPGKYVVLATDKVNNYSINNDPIKDKYEVATTGLDYLKVIDPEDFKKENGDYDYTTFPGHEVIEDTMLLGVRIGNEEIDVEDRKNPSNIVRRFFNEVNGGYNVKVNAGINPNNGDYEFTVTDKNGNPLIIMKNDPVSGVDGGDYVDDDGTIYLKNLGKAIKNKGEREIFPAGEDMSKLAPFSITIRTKNKQTISGERSEITIDDKDIEDYENQSVIDFESNTTFGILKKDKDDDDDDDGDRNFKFSNVESFKVVYEGKGNKFDILNMIGTNVKIIDGGPEGLPPVNKTEEDILDIISSEGLYYEGDVEMISGKENKRNRITDIKIDVLNNGFEIKNIKE